jgi:hypothetical protein
MKETQHSDVKAPKKRAIDFLSQASVKHQGPDILRQTLKVALFDYINETKIIGNGILVNNHQILIAAHFFLGSGKKNRPSFADEIFHLDRYQEGLEKLELTSNIDADRGRRDLVIFDRDDRKLLEIKNINFQDFLNGFDERVSMQAPLPLRDMIGIRPLINRNVGILSFLHDFSDDLEIKSLPFRGSLPNEGDTAYMIGYRTVEGKQLQYATEFKLDGKIFGIGSDGIIRDSLVKAADPELVSRQTSYDLGSPLIVKNKDGSLSIHGFMAGRIKGSFYHNRKLVDSELFLVLTDNSTLKLFERNQIAVDTSPSCID